MAGTNRRAQPAPPRRSSRSSRARQPEPKAKRRFFDYPRSGYTGLHRWMPSWRFMLGSFLTGVFLVAGALVAAYAKVQPPNPSDDIFAQTTTVYYADTVNADGSVTPGEVMGTFADQKREIVDFATLPKYVGDAVVASEDRTFYTNSGVDLKGIARAFVNNVSGGATQGASTLTQQYVERYYVNKTTSDYLGKFNEALLAVKISRQESKEEILGRYLNTIYFGRDSYGIQAAAQSYFNVNAADLTISQAALLSGVIPSPNNWDPAVSPDKAEQKWNRVLDNMVEDGWITADERAAQTFPETVVYTRSETYRGPAGYLLEMVRDEIIANVPSITDESLDRGGYKIVTTIQKPVQDQAVAAVNSLWDGTLADGAVPSDRMKVAIASVDPADGGIVALYGGKDYLEDSINRATYDAVQAGSTFKPFALVAALESGIPLTKTYNGASPQTFGDWSPGNFDGEQFGDIDLIKATAQSVNTVYAQLNIEVGPDKTVAVARDAGVTTEVEANAANVLGTATVHPIDMAGAYATFAAQGWQADPFIVRTITNPDDSLAYQGGDERSQVIPSDVMADATYAMTQVVQEGSGKTWVKPLGKSIAGKTGTSTGNKSAWFVGYTPTIATAVAFSQVGEDGKSQDTITPFGNKANGKKITEITGATWPSALWAAYMGPVLDMPQFAKDDEFPPRANVGPSPSASPTVTETPTEAPPTETAAPAQVTVPSGLNDKLEADATSALLQNGLVPAVTSEYSDSVTKGRVIRTDPGGGTTLDTGSTVALVISLGPKPVETPAPTVAPTPTPTPSQTAQGGQGGQGG
ncbi:transglycosylase domain-containing protein [Cellulomonas soli]|uniref:PASTA domain-containing protein n=1 Tax=Cellulomonas soli TaxID=931535 RepID=A0A512PI83_9CELL|nr:transglycosylase domain-containing protein [Cellulomonas soli]NYI58724.1 membrane peptidoglycan carboxypeptidase [Cellulomonas soli]GEP70893.1 hypothetical protein CSO01_36080 [Cellulomonas soli]